MQINPMYNGIPMESYGAQPLFQQQYGMGQQMPMQFGQPQRPKIDPRQYETPQIVLSTEGETHKPLFTVDGTKNPITIDAPIKSTNSKRKAVKKEEGETTSEDKQLPVAKVFQDNNSVEHISGNVENPATIYSYQETNGLLHQTLSQIDAINGELVQEFNAIRQNRTMKNKYMVLNDLSENIGSMISNRIATIKEINNCITKANDLDYKKYKDVQAAQAAVNDDKYIADMYQAFISNPGMQAQTLNLVDKSAMIDPAVIGSGIVRANINKADIKPGETIDAGYLGYLSNLTPEQNLMRYENDPNVKQVVVFDASTGAKMFQYMNMATGEVINNVPTYGDNIMEDTTLDLKAGIAKNLNLNETFPIVQINNNITSQY